MYDTVNKEIFVGIDCAEVYATDFSTMVTNTNIILGRVCARMYAIQFFYKIPTI